MKLTACGKNREEEKITGSCLSLILPLSCPQKKKNSSNIQGLDQKVL